MQARASNGKKTRKRKNVRGRCTKHQSPGWDTKCKSAHEHDLSAECDSSLLRSDVERLSQRLLRVLGPLRRVGFLVLQQLLCGGALRRKDPVDCRHLALGLLDALAHHLRDRTRLEILHAARSQEAYKRLFKDDVHVIRASARTRQF
eukprot:6196131-Pleurochrysis_carterae.AAC.1